MHLIRYKMSISSKELECLKITVASMRSRDGKPLLPDSMIEHYESLGLEFNFGSVLPCGKAKSKKELLPEASKPRTPSRGHIILVGNDYYFAVGGNYPKFAELGQIEEGVITRKYEEYAL